MKIVLAPDSFKGSISAWELSAALREGLRAAEPSAEVIEMPMADGGEGTMEALVHATGGHIREIEVHDPLGRKISAAYGILGDQETVVVEMAKAAGLPLLAPHERNPLITSTYGLGELVRHAAGAGFRRFIVGLGGSATNDGGAGALSAMGVRFFGEDGAAFVPEGGAGLARLKTIDLSGMDEAVRASSFMLASDVANPLCGPSGASAVFGLQKGATPEMAEQLDKALQRYGEVLQACTGRGVREQPGSGAAGGTGAGFMAVLGARCRSGIEIVMEAVRFDRRIRDADLIITGEGRLDGQTLSGKVIAGVCRTAAQHAIPVIGVCGSMALDGKQMDQLGLTAAFSIAPGPCTLETAMRQAADWARGQGEQIMRLAASVARKASRG